MHLCIQQKDNIRYTVCQYKCDHKEYRDDLHPDSTNSFEIQLGVLFFDGPYDDGVSDHNQKADDDVGNDVVVQFCHSDIHEDSPEEDTWGHGDDPEGVDTILHADGGNVLAVVGLKRDRVGV